MYSFPQTVHISSETAPCVKGRYVTQLQRTISWHRQSFLLIRMNEVFSSRTGEEGGEGVYVHFHIVID